MPQIVKTIGDFSLESTWTGTRVGTNSNGDPIYNYTDSAAATKSRTFSLEGLPANAILDSAILAATLNSPYTGIRARQVDGVTFSGTMNVLSKLQELGGNYGSGVTFAYRFRAWGESGGAGSHSSTQNFTANTLTVTYHQPNSLLTLEPANEAYAGAVITASIDADSQAYTHKLAWAIGSHIGETVLAAGATQAEFTFPPEWLDVIPDKQSVTGTAVLYTYSGAALLGASSRSITVKVPEGAVPQNIQVTPSPVDQKLGRYVESISSLKLNTTASGSYGSTIGKAEVYQIVLGQMEKVKDASLAGGVWTAVTPALTASGDAEEKTYVVKVTDSLGRTAQSGEVRITVYDYYLPKILNPIIQRCQPDKTPDPTGTYIGVYAEFDHASVGGDNHASGTVKYRQMPSGEWLEAQPLPNQEITAIGGGAISVTQSYQVCIEYKDALEKKAEYTEDVGTGACLFDAYMDTAFAFFGYADNDGLEVKGGKELRYKGQTLDERFAPAGSYAAADHNHDSTYLKLAGGTLTGNLKTQKGTPTANFATQFRQDAFGDTGYFNTVKPIRTDTANIPNAPQYSAGLAWSTYDTHGFLYTTYNTSNKTAYIGGGSAQAINWTAKLYHSENLMHGTGSPSGGSSGDVYLKHA